MRALLRYLLFALLVVLAAGSALAQDETPTAITDSNRSGDLPYSSTVGTGIEHVVVASGTLVVSVPIIGLKGRGMGFNFALNYDSHALNVVLRGSGGGWNFEKRNYLSSKGLWFPNQPFLTYGFYTSNQCYLGGSGTITGRNGFLLQDASGGKHVLGANWEHAECLEGFGWDILNNGPDASALGMWLNLFPTGGANQGRPQSLYSDDGMLTAAGGFTTSNPGDLHTTQAGFGTFLDTNGNLKTEAAGGSDTLGRVIVTQTNPTNQIVYAVSDSAGTSRSYTVNLTNITVATNFGIPGVADYSSATRVAVSSIVLPNGRSYSFLYNGYGEVTQLTYPTGAVVTYGYATMVNGTCSYRYVSSRSVNVNGQNSTWSFSHGSPGSCPAGQQSAAKTVTVTDPLGNQSVYAVDYQGNTTSAKLYQGAATGTPLRQYTIGYYCAYSSMTGACLASTITTQLENGLVSKKEFDYDSLSYDRTYCTDGYDCTNFGTTTESDIATRGNVLEIREYDWGSGSPGALLRRTHKTYLHDSNANYIPINIVSKVLQNTVYDGSGTQVAQTQYEYDNYVTGDNPLQSATGAAQHDDTNHGTGFTLRGNVTRVKRWRNTDGALLTTTYSYDMLGNIRAIKDPLTHTTSFDYTDSFANAFCAPPTGKTGQAWVSTVTNALSQQIKVTRFPCTSLVQAHKDQNDINAARAGTTYTYDLFGRPTQKNLPDGGQSSNSYNDVPPLSVSITTAITSTLNLTSTVTQDGLGRTTQSKLTSDPGCAAGDKTDTTYDLLGRVSTVSNPYCSTSDPTYGITTTQYDALSRITKLIPPDGTTSANNVTTAYSGNCTTATDQAGKSRKSCSDGLGRLIQAFEDPTGANYETDYTYDALNNLLTVNQKGGSTSSASWRTRTFTYDSLSRLLSASNPESGTISYTYDNAGNLATKTAPAPNQTGSANVTTTYSYDALNRLTQKSYSDGTTPPAYSAYDTPPSWGVTQTNPIGRLVEDWTGQTCCATTAEIFSYDAMGRALLNEQYTQAMGYKTMNYTYDLAGNMTTFTDGVGETYTQTFNAASRVTQFNSSWVDSQHPAVMASGISYNPAGAITKMTYGNGLTETNAYNTRLQPCRYNTNSSGNDLAACTDAVPSGNLLDFSYSFNAGSSNNGNVASMTATGQQAFSRSYTYDSLNRIATMADSNTSQSCRGLSWTIDPWGNRTDQTVTAGTCNTFHQVADANNRLSGAPYQYDAAGNMIHDASHSYTYDAENRLISVDGGSTASYVYDASGRRAQKTAGGAQTNYIYDLAGQVITEVSPSTWLNVYLRLNGNLFAQYTVGQPRTQFIHTDHLGSTRLVTDLSGNVVDSMDYLPFGEQIAGSSATSHKFTSKERDPESGLDNFGARYDSSSLGRFMSPDPRALGLRHLTNPQKLNRYAYVLNNPLTYWDPDGLEEITFWGAVSKIVSAFKAKGEAGVGVEYRVHLGKAEGKVGASVKGEVAVSSKGVDIKATAEVSAKVHTPIPGVEGAVGRKAEVQTMKDSNAVPIKDQHVEITPVEAKVGTETKEGKADSNSELGVGLTLSAGGGVAGFDLSVNTKEVLEGGAELAVLGQQYILQQLFPGILPPPPDSQEDACKDKKCKEPEKKTGQ